jgi:hypothetical protein
VQKQQAFTYQPHKTFQWDMLPLFADGLGVSYEINDDNSITFSSFNVDSLEECWDELYLYRGYGEYKIC